VTRVQAARKVAGKSVPPTVPPVSNPRGSAAVGASDDAVIELAGRRLRAIDLSHRLSNATSAFEPNPHRIEYVEHGAGARASDAIGIDPSLWPEGRAWAVELVHLSTHAGTHVDAPWHYAPTSGGAPARTIDEVPLRWCIGNGVLLDMTHKRAGDGITDADCREALDRLGYALRPYDIVLVRTDASRHFREPGYELRHPGLRRSATAFLVEHGVKLIGIDAWGLDRPFDVMAGEARAGDTAQLWESHFYGSEREYCQIEKLENLAALPTALGFTVVALPVLLEGASAAWSRVVALFDEPAGSGGA
jgi:kynurenine formamidase